MCRFYHEEKRKEEAGKGEFGPEEENLEESCEKEELMDTERGYDETDYISHGNREEDLESFLDQERKKAKRERRDSSQDTVQSHWNNFY